MVFEQLISVLGSQAVFAVYLPFLLMFSIFYALLTKVKLFGDEKARVNSLIAFIMALYVAAYSPASAAIAMWFATIFTGLGVTLVSILSIMLIVLMLLAPFWDKITAGDKWGNAVRPLAYLGIIIGFLVVLGSTYGISGSVGGIDIPGLTSADVTFLMLVIFTLLIIWFMTGVGPKLPSGGMIPLKFG